MGGLVQGLDQGMFTKGWGWGGLVQSSDQGMYTKGRGWRGWIQGSYQCMYTKGKGMERVDSRIRSRYVYKRLWMGRVS